MEINQLISANFWKLIH